MARRQEPHTWHASSEDDTFLQTVSILPTFHHETPFLHTYLLEPTTGSPIRDEIHQEANSFSAETNFTFGTCPVYTIYPPYPTLCHMPFLFTYGTPLLNRHG